MSPFRDRRSSQKGTALVEAALSTVFLVAAISGGMSLSYFLFARVWLERSAYEAIICLSTSTPAHGCEKELMESSKRALPFGEVSNVRLRRDRRAAAVDLKFRVQGKDVIRMHQSRKLPLRAAD